jgi:hypothetical protein
MISLHLHIEKKHQRDQIFDREEVEVLDRDWRSLGDIVIVKKRSPSSEEKQNGPFPR